MFDKFSIGNFYLREHTEQGLENTPEETKSSPIPFTGEWGGWGKTIFDTLSYLLKHPLRTIY